MTEPVVLQDVAASVAACYRFCDIRTSPPGRRGAVGLDTGWKGCSMPRYYFDLVDDETVYDKKGVSLPNIKAAEQYAATFARELMETKPTLMGEAWKAWSVQICNGKFERILKIPFAQIKDLDRSASDDAPQPA
jgi:hypothetical protein